MTLRVIVIGGGMYVTGRGSGTDGTIGPALLEGVRAGYVSEITVVTTSAQTAKKAAQALSDTSERVGVAVPIDYWPNEGADNAATYQQILSLKRHDVAVVSTPDDTHAAITEAAAAAGLHILVVKPLAPTTIDANRMIAAVERAGVFGAVEFHKRYDEANLIMRNEVAEGKLGKPLYAVIEYSQRKAMPTEIFRSWASNVSVFQYLGVHYVDLLQFVTGLTPSKVTCWAQNLFLKSQGIDTADAMQTVIEWERDDGDSFVSMHATNWIDPNVTTAISDQKISLIGTNGRYVSDQKHRGVNMVDDLDGPRDINPYFTACWHDKGAGSYTYRGYGITSILTFLTDVLALRAGQISITELIKTRPSFQACKPSTAVIEAAHRSLATGSKPIAVEV